MLRVAGAFIVVVVFAACGDNSKFCGQGTDDRDGDGECEAVVPEVVCGVGTIVDPIMNACMPDPAICASGTRFVNGRCQDPAVATAVDLEEGPEPNAFEPGAVPAGVITLRSANEPGVVLHGCVAPVDDTTPDLDVYQLEVSAPTLLKITADGVGGLVGGFEITSTEPPLATWKRYGVTVAGDTARREVLLPSAGRYRLAITDARTLLPALAGGAPVPAGLPDGTSCYYVTIDQRILVATAFATSATGTLAEDVPLFTAPLTGPTQLTATYATAHAQEAIVVLKNNAFHAFDDDGSITITGVTAADSVVFAADFVYNAAVFSVPFTLTSP